MEKSSAQHTDYMTTPGLTWDWRPKILGSEVRLQHLENHAEKLLEISLCEDFYTGDSFTFELGQNYVYSIDEDDEEEDEDNKLLMEFLSDPKSSKSCTFTFKFEKPPKESMRALFVLELVHQGDDKENLCLTNILHFTKDDYEYVYENCLELEYLEDKKFIHTHRSSRYLSFNIHIHHLREPEDPGFPCMYMSPILRSYMLSFYGLEVIGALKDACAELAQDLSLSADIWSSLRKETKSHLEKNFFNSFDKNQIWGIINASFPHATYYPALMELLHLGIERADDLAKPYRDKLGLEQLISHPPKPVSEGQEPVREPDIDTLCLKGNFGHVTRTYVPKYASAMSAKVELKTYDDLVGECVLSGWCAIQLIAAARCFSEVVTTGVSKTSSKSTPAKSTPRKNKRSKNRNRASKEPTIRKPPPQSHRPMPKFVTGSPSNKTTLVNVLKQKDVKLQQKDARNMVKWIGFDHPEKNFTGRVDCDGSLSLSRGLPLDTAVLSEKSIPVMERLKL